MNLRPTLSLSALVPVSPILLAGVTGLLAIGGCTPVPGSRGEFRPDNEPVPAPTPVEVAWREIGAGAVGRDIRFLASDARRGRATPGPGLERAAAWLATELYGTGIEPAGDDGGYLQYWPYEGDRLPPDSGVVQVPNVVGRLAGSDLERAGEYVVLIAHYDHLGVGEPSENGDSIYNGANDNASGVAALAAVARAFGALTEPTARPLLFLAVSGSEEGLLGSRWFARHPTVPLTGAVAVLNLDAIGRNHPDSIAVVGYGRSGLGPLLEEVAAATPRLDLAVTPASDDPDSLFPASDHFPFARMGIPAVQLFAGSHEDNRTPADEAGRVDADKVARVARLVFLAAHRLASTGEDVTLTDR